MDIMLDTVTLTNIVKLHIQVSYCILPKITQFTQSQYSYLVP